MYVMFILFVSSTFTCSNTDHRYERNALPSPEGTMKTLQQTEMNLENAQRKIEELAETLSKTQMS